MQITDLPTSWRNKWAQAQFRGAIFFVETDQRQGGRRVALHQYPKRNTPYAEDMGRAAVQITVTGYIIGFDYIRLKDALIAALEVDGPGMLRLPMQYLRKDLEVMVMSYGITESRERGGMCVINMQFCEYGNPSTRATVSTPEEIMKSAAAAEKQLLGPIEGKDSAEKLAAMAPYTKVFLSAKAGA